MFCYQEEIPEAMKQNFMQCPKCAMFFDATNLQEVLYHEMDHSEGDLIQLSKRITCRVCGCVHFEARQQNGMWLGLYCEQCGQSTPLPEEEPEAEAA